MKTIKTGEIDFSKVEKIYNGLDRHCRCGCGGKYFSICDAKFDKKVTAIKSLDEVEADVTEKYINISLKNNRAYTIYFK